MPQLAGLIRTKYPGEYDDMDDAALEKAVLAKYPEYEDLATPPNKLAAPVAAKPTVEPRTPVVAPVEQPPTPITTDEEPSESFLGKAWRVANEPLITAPSKVASQIADVIDQPSVERSPWEAKVRGFGAGVTQGLGDVISSLTSPVNLAMTAASAGAVRGIPGMGMASRVISAPFAAHGAVQTFDPESTLSERAMGIAEMAGGIAGMRGHIGDVTESLKKGEVPVTEVPKVVTKAGKPVIDEAGRVIAPPQTEIPKRPTGPWDTNASVEPIPEGVSIGERPERFKPITPTEAPTKPTGKQSLKVGTTITVKADQVPANWIQESAKQGYEFAGKTETGDYRFKKIGIGEEAPLADVETMKPANITNLIRRIPETGNTEFDSMVKSLKQAKSTRRIGYAEYSNLVNEIRNHPSMPPEMEARWAQMEQQNSATLAARNVAKPTGPEGPLMTEADLPTTQPEIPTIPPETTPIRPRQPLTSEEGWIGTRPPKGPITDVPIPEEPPIIVPKGQGSAQQRSDQVRELRAKGYELAGTDENGDWMFRKTSRPEGMPILEEDVGLLRPTKRHIKKEETIIREGELGPKTDIKKANPYIESVNLTRALKASIDLSAPLRQGFGLIHKKQFWTSLKPMMKSWASEEGFIASQNDIAARPLFRKRVGAKGKTIPSFADDAGLQLTDLTSLTSREEAIMSTWAEKVPGVRASNRAYTAFLNNLRADTFESLMKNSNTLGANATKNLPFAQSLADFVNAASGRGSLGRLERAAPILNSTLFSPRLVASRLTMLDPRRYLFGPKQVRMESLKSLMAMAGVGGIIGEAVKQMGGTVESDPNSADFGKARIGNTRIDPYAGFQQYIVAANRLLRPGFAKVPGLENVGDTGSSTLNTAIGMLGTGGQKVTSTNTPPGFPGKEYDLWNPRRPFDPTHIDVAGRMLRGKLHPVYEFAVSMLSGMKDIQGRPLKFDTMDVQDITKALSGQMPMTEMGKKFISGTMENALAKQFIPLFLQDMYEMSQTDPDLMPITVPYTLFGGGVQSYTPEQ